MEPTQLVEEKPYQKKNTPQEISGQRKNTSEGRHWAKKKKKTPDNWKW